MARFALLLAVVGCTTRDRLVALDEPAPNLVISQTHQSFGEVPVGSSATATVRVSNNGSAPSAPLAPTLNGDAAFAVDGTCTSDALAPGASCDLRVTFVPAAFGPAAATVAIGGSLALPVDGYGRGTVRLSLNASGGGRLNFCNSGPCVVTFDVGDTVPTAHIEATPDAGWAVLAWSGDCAGSASRCELQMDRDRSVAVTFAKLATVSVEATSVAGGGGEIRIDPSTFCKVPCRLSTTVTLGTRVTVRAIPDAASQFRWTDGCHAGGGDCTVTVDTDTPVKAVFNGANYVFVTSTQHSSAEGVAAYDAACNERALAGGLPGPYQAWVTTTSTPAERRIGNARGFIRLDGLPFMEVLDPAAPVDYPVVFDEQGQRVPDGLLERMYLSGRSTYGGVMMLTCHDWTSVDPSWSDGVITGDPLAGILFWDGAASTTGCALKWRLLCVGTALTRPLHADPAAGRFAFASAEERAADAGVAAFDAACAREASAAHLPGSYKALVASEGAAAVSRFDLNGPPWVRPDGVALVARAADLATGSLMSPFNVHADSTQEGTAVGFWTGAAAPSTPGTPDTTCNGWTSSAPGVHGIVGRNMTIEPGTWFDIVPATCDVRARVYCLQE